MSASEPRGQIEKSDSPQNEEPAPHKRKLKKKKRVLSEPDKLVRRMQRMAQSAAASYGPVRTSFPALAGTPAPQRASSSYATTPASVGKASTPTPFASSSLLPDRGRDTPAPYLTQPTHHAFAAAIARDVDEARATLRSEKATLAGALRLALQVSKDESSRRLALATEERTAANHLYREFTQQRMVLTFVTSVRMPSTDASPSRQKRGAAKAAQSPEAVLRSPRTTEQSRRAADAIYGHTHAVRIPLVKEYARSHYHHPLPASATVDVLPQMLSYECRLTIVREGQQRRQLDEDEQDEWACMLSNFHSIAKIFMEIGRVPLLPIHLLSSRSRGVGANASDVSDSNPSTKRTRTVLLRHKSIANAASMRQDSSQMMPTAVTPGVEVQTESSPRRRAAQHHPAAAPPTATPTSSPAASSASPRRDDREAAERWRASATSEDEARVVEASTTVADAFFSASTARQLSLEIGESRKELADSVAFAAVSIRETFRVAEVLPDLALPAPTKPEHYDLLDRSLVAASRGELVSVPFDHPCVRAVDLHFHRAPKPGGDCQCEVRLHLHELAVATSSVGLAVVGCNFSDMGVRLVCTPGGERKRLEVDCDRGLWLPSHHAACTLHATPRADAQMPWSAPQLVIVVSQPTTTPNAVGDEASGVQHHNEALTVPLALVAPLFSAAVASTGTPTPASGLTMVLQQTISVPSGSTLAGMRKHVADGLTSFFGLSDGAKATHNTAYSLSWPHAVSATVALEDSTETASENVALTIRVTARRRDVAEMVSHYCAAFAVGHLSVSSV